MIQKTHGWLCRKPLSRLTGRARTFILTMCCAPSIPASRVVVACVCRSVGREEIK